MEGGGERMIPQLEKNVTVFQGQDSGLLNHRHVYAMYEDTYIVNAILRTG